MKSLLQSRLFWAGLLTISLTCDFALAWGGYEGRIGAMQFSIVKFFCLICCVVALVFCVSWCRREKSWSLVLGASVVCVVLVCDFLVLSGNRDPFFRGAITRAGKDISPAQLQAWAMQVISQHDSGEDFFIPGGNLPSFIRIAQWRPSGAYVRSSLNARHVDIVWGGGMVGSYGVSVGPASYVAHNVQWRPGIYFFRSP